MKYTYVIVNAKEREGLTVRACTQPHPKVSYGEDLGALLAEGWEPVRETAAGESWLVLLQKS